MSEDQLLRELGLLAREEARAEARFDERWDRLAAGTLTAEEDAQLRALAETSEEARIAYEAFAPLGPDFHRRVVQKIRNAAEPDRKRRPFWQRLRRPARWSAAAAAGASAAAAAVTALLRLWPIPAYVVAEVSGGTSVMRGESQARVFAPGDRLQVALSPQTRVVRAKLAAHCFLIAGNELRRLEMRTEVDPQGAVKLEGVLPGDLAPGAWTLWAVVGRRGDLPDPADLLRVSPAAAVRERNWVAVPELLRIRPRAP